MILDLTQRIQRLRVRNGELQSWRIVARSSISGWTFEDSPIEVGAPWPTAEGVVRFAASAEVAEDWPIEETRLSIDLGGESLVTLSYASGETESFGLDPYHDEFPLKARRFALTSESVARRPFGQPVRAPTLARAELIWVDIAVERLELLIDQVAEAAEALGEDEASAPMLEAAEAALRGLDWPTFTPDYVARIASTRQSQAIWRLPDVDPDPPGMTAAERKSVVAADEALRAKLRELRGRFPPRGRVALTGHAHIDLAWLWPYDETRRKLHRTFHTALSLIERHEEFRFNQSTAHYYWQLEQDDPALLARIREKAESGAWEVIGGTWVEPDTNMPTGESFVRQLLYGQRFFERAFGARSTVHWLPDCFGFSPALPQLLRQAGIDSFFTIKLNWSERNKFPYDLFWWEGLDGSRVLAHTFDNPLAGYNGHVKAEAIVPTWRNFRGKLDHDETLLAVGYGDGGGGVTPDMIERAKNFADFPALPSVRWTSVKEFFSHAHKSAERRDLPRWRGELYLELHRATLTTQSGVKKRHRAAERALIAAEVAGCLGHLIGAPAPESLEASWRAVMKNEFHDILPGSSIREVYLDAEAELQGAIEAAHAAERLALAAIVANAPRGGVADALVVVNPTLTARPLTARLDEGAEIASDEIVPPLSICVFDRARINAAPGLKAIGRRLENAHLSVEIGDDGAIASLVHKASGREALAGRGNQLWAYHDKPRSWDAWDIDEDYEAGGEEVTRVERLALVERGPHFAAIRVERRYRSSRIAQIYRLAANARRLDIMTELDVGDRRVLIRTLTPAAARATYATFECAYGVIERATHRNTSWEQAMFEAVAHRFVDLSEPGFGLSLLNDAKYGHSVRDNVLGLSLVRAPIYPDPLADEGEQTFTYALMPHAGAWHEAGVREEAEALNQRLLVARAKNLAEGARAPVGISGVNAALSALKIAEDGNGLILRVYEPCGARGAFAVNAPEGWRIEGSLNLMEEPAHEVRADLMPFEVRTWRLRKDG